MFQKKDKSFSRKKILKFAKQSGGSIAIIVLIVGIAVVVTVGALSAYMIKDIKFTQLDEQKLKALNIAEAGIADMYSNLDLFYNGDINGVKTPLPGETTDGIIYFYDGDVSDAAGVLGTYHVQYMLEESSYVINSTGTDLKSGVKRKVAVRINISGEGSTFEIYDFIYSGNPVKIAGSGDIDVNGTLFINADFDLAGTGEHNIGNMIVRGNLTISGNTTTISGPIYVGGDLRVDGGISISSGYINPLIVVMGNIDKKGTSGTIGTPEKLVEIFHGGSITGTPIYYFESENVYTFDYPQIIVTEYITEFKDEISTSKYVISTSLTLNSDMAAGTGTIIGNSDNQINFYKDINNNYILEIKGNIFVNGDIIIDSTVNPIYYKGKGKLFSTHDINVYSKLIPVSSESTIPPLSIETIFPDQSLLFLVADNNISLDIAGTDDGSLECTNPDLSIIGIAGNQLSFDTKGITVRGTLIAGKIMFDTGTGDLGKICYDEKIIANLPDDIPSGVKIFSQVGWQELVP